MVLGFLNPEGKISVTLWDSEVSFRKFCPHLPSPFSFRSLPAFVLSKETKAKLPHTEAW